ncbi:hypothetical protein BJX64DRAFT_257475 [Aspergillus heterothallicus]
MDRDGFMDDPGLFNLFGAGLPMSCYLALSLLLGLLGLKRLSLTLAGRTDAC